jgi:RNA polymerase sigma-70 factor (ECF subfamily)
MIINAMYHQAPERIQSEFDWIEQAKLDPQKFGRLYNKYYNQIFRYVNQKVFCTEKTADITAQVFFKAFCNLHKYQFKGVPFGSWLYRIAKSEIYQTFRDEAKTQLSCFETLNFSLFLESCNEDDTEENIARLKSCLSKLRDEEYQIISLRFYDGLSFKQIGEYLGMSENNAKVKCFRCISKLKKLYFGVI